MDIQESIDLIMSHQEHVAETFYERYFARHPEARRFFEGLDMKRQAVMLGMVLLLVMQHHRRRYAATESYLKALGQTHTMRRQVPAEMYGPFCECLIEVLGDVHGEHWSAELERTWREAFELSVALMKQGSEGAGKTGP